MGSQQQQHMLQDCINNPTHIFGDYLEQFLNTEIDEQNEEKFQFSHTQLLENKIPFLQMLQKTESPQKPFSPFLTEASSFHQPFMKIQNSKTQALELESCITHETKLEDLQYPFSGSCIEGVSSEIIETGKTSVSSPVFSAQLQPQQLVRAKMKSPAITRERRKRKRATRVCKNKEEVENQRMTHIAVERNRRRQMNDRLNSLRSLMPASYVQRGDQASIIGGAIDFVKELEHHLQSLQSRKRLKKSDESLDGGFTTPFISAGLKCTLSTDENSTDEGKNGNTVENGSEAADIEVTVVQTHVNLKIQCERKHGLLLKAIVALEELRLSVLHLNITSFQSSVLYSFNLRIEEDCKIGSAEGILGSVHQIFNYINQR